MSDYPTRYSHHPTFGCVLPHPRQGDMHGCDCGNWYAAVTVDVDDEPGLIWQAMEEPA